MANNAVELSEDKVLQALNSLCTAHLGQGVRSAAPLSDQGTWHRLYRVVLVDGRDIIARFNVQGTAVCAHAMLLDQWANRILKSAGLPALTVHAVDLTRTFCPWVCTLLAPAQGVCLRHLDEDEETLLPLLRSLGAFLGAVHQIRAAGYGLLVPAENGSAARGTVPSWPEYLCTRLDAHLRVCRQIHAISRTEENLICRLFDDSGPALECASPVLLHGDPGNHNAFAHGGAISCLIDWEDALAGDPIYEVALWATFHPQRRHRVFFEGYFANRTPAADFPQRFWLYFLRVALAKTVVRHNLGLQDRPGRAPAALRIQLALDSLQRDCAA